MNGKQDLKDFYENWAQLRSEDHDFLGDIDKCIDMASLIPSNNRYKNILEIGCGFGMVLKYFGKKYDAKITGTDISQYFIEYCKK
ncbi:MAG: class I SAM-dependent methyltransferase, partial [Candidatus Woesearchaeota archaeon]